MIWKIIEYAGIVAASLVGLFLLFVGGLMWQTRDGKWNQ